jgi:fructosamine-3-kinase
VIRTDDLLNQVLGGLARAGVDLEGYRFSVAAGTTQATVWKGTSPRSDRPDVAVRLTPKPVDLLRRIAVLIDGVRSVECPRTLALEQILINGETWSVHLCTWIGLGAADVADLRLLGEHLARLHRDMALAEADFTDRRLSFGPSPVPDSARHRPAWAIAQDVWADRIVAWTSLSAQDDALQPIHGDLHRGNLVAAPGGFAFIDFDKVMFAPTVFDLAKLIATSLFQPGKRTRFQARKAADLLAGYTSVRPLNDAELTALEGLVILANAETARWGNVHERQAHRDNAEAIGSWWITRRETHGDDPLGIRTNRRPSPPSSPRTVTEQAREAPRTTTGNDPR